MKEKIKWLAILLFALIAFSNFWVIQQTHEEIITDTRELIGAEVGLVLGTSKQLQNGNENPFFKNRIAAAAELVKAGKVEKLLLSGSSDEQYYDEPDDMLAALVELGVSKEKLILDNQGDRTLESVARMKDIYGYKQCVIVTQKYHAYRALFIAQQLGLDAQCYVAKSPDFGDHAKAILREVFARTKAILDLYILGK